MPEKTERKKQDRYLGLRIPGDLLEQLRQLAFFEERSLNNLALRAFRAYLANPGGCEQLRREAEGKKPKQ